ncbi:hypothetical protein HDZ31DRAFT_45563, partial [Schizophyllum fasciatum]
MRSTLALLDDSASRLPSDIRTIIQSLDLTPPVDAYVCCPTCFSLYPEDRSPACCERRLLP